MLNGMFPSIDISAAGLSVQRTRMNVTASNIANVNTTKMDGIPGQPYKRQRVTISSNAGPGTFQLMLRQAADEGLSLTDSRHLQMNRGMNIKESRISSVGIDEIFDDPTPPRMIYDPVHPDSNADGYVAMPDINIVVEMVDMIPATRAYEANITAITAAKSMARQAIDL